MQREDSTSALWKVSRHSHTFWRDVGCWCLLGGWTRRDVTESKVSLTGDWLLLRRPFCLGSEKSYSEISGVTQHQQLPRRGQFSGSDLRTPIKAREPPQISSFDASRVIRNQAAKDLYPSHPLRQRTQGFMCGKMVLPLPASRRQREPSFPIPSIVRGHLGEKQGRGKEMCKGKEIHLPKLGSCKETVYQAGSNLTDKTDFISPLPANKGLWKR